MRVSDERKTKLYKAISDPLMRLRINVATGQLNQKQVDEALFRLETILYNDVKKTLNIK